jgi:hypothetical protein
MTRSLCILSSILILIGLASCDMLSTQTQNMSDPGVTQAFQTVQSRLTQGADRNPTETLVPSPTEPEILSGTPSSASTANAPTYPSNSIPSSEICDLAGAGIPIDVTIPDDTEIAPGEAFTKVWRLVNAGTCIWKQGYSIALFSGDSMKAPENLPLSFSVAPGDVFEISIDMIAPTDAGTYQGNWKLKNESGEWFGIGPSGGAAFWVRIIVPQSTTITPSPTMLVPTNTPTNVVQTNGPATLYPGDRLNLDDLELNSGSGDDLAYLLDEEDEKFLGPQGSAILSEFGMDQPEFEDCNSASMYSLGLLIEELEQGVFLCYRTDLGLPGWVKYVDFDQNDYSLTVEIFTWALP